MARNEEKAQSMLNRYLREKQGDDGVRKKRPYLATLCEDVDEAQQWRGQVVREVRRRVSEIQNPGLGDERVRELNDLINKLLREKRHWERRITFLGGPRFVATPLADADVFESGGYYYFGAARELPGVHDLIERQRALQDDRDKLRAQEDSTAMYARLDERYYGRAEVDEQMLQEVEESEKKARRKLIAQWKEENVDKVAEFGEDARWDDSFLRFVGRKPEPASSEALEVMQLERAKMDALELLRGSVLKKKS